MAKKIVKIDDPNINRQVDELLHNLSEENFPAGFVVTSPNGSKFRIMVSDDGRLYTKEVKGGM